MRVETNKFGHIRGYENFTSRKEFVVKGLTVVQYIYCCQGKSASAVVLAVTGHGTGLGLWGWGGMG